MKWQIHAAPAGLSGLYLGISKLCCENQDGQDAGGVVERDSLPDIRIWVIARRVIELGSTHTTCSSFCLQMEDLVPQRLINLHAASQLAFRRPESEMASLAS